MAKAFLSRQSRNNHSVSIVTLNFLLSPLIYPIFPEMADLFVFNQIRGSYFHPLFKGLILYSSRVYWQVLDRALV